MEEDCLPGPPDPAMEFEGGLCMFAINAPPSKRDPWLSSSPGRGCDGQAAAEMSMPCTNGVDPFMYNLHGASWEDEVAFTSI